MKMKRETSALNTIWSSLNGLIPVDFAMDGWTWRHGHFHTATAKLQAIEIKFQIPFFKFSIANFNSATCNLFHLGILCAIRQLSYFNDAAAFVGTRYIVIG